MSCLRIAVIVEGDGEVEAVPVLFRRYAELAGVTGRVPETEDQPSLTAVFDLDAAKAACVSFDKCDREMLRLLQQVAALSP